MEFSLVVAVWGLLIVGPSTAALLIGNWIGSRRAEYAFNSMNEPMGFSQEAEAAAQALVVEAWCVPGETTPRLPKSKEEPARQPSPVDRRRAFATMPGLEELSAKIEEARQADRKGLPSVWDDPELAEARKARNLTASDVSIQSSTQLHPLCDEAPHLPTSDDNDGWLYLSNALPRIAEAAPLELTTRVDELMQMRAAQLVVDDAPEAADQLSASPSLTRV